jgi:hypothetical protein
MDPDFFELCGHFFASLLQKYSLLVYRSKNVNDINEYIYKMSPSAYVAQRDEWPCIVRENNLLRLMGRHHIWQELYLFGHLSYYIQVPCLFIPSSGKFLSNCKILSKINSKLFIQKLYALHFC